MISTAKKKYCVLVFPGGTEVGLEIMKGLRWCKEVRLVSASSPVANHAPLAYSRHYSVRPISDNAWVEDLNQVIKRERVDFVFPANSLVIDALITNLDAVQAKILIAPVKVVNLCRSKTATLRALSSLVAVPKIYSKIEEVKDFPVFVKPDRMYGAQGAQVVSTRAQLNDAFDASKKMVIQEYLPGAEYTVDCFSNPEGRLLFALPRTRERIRMGTSMRSHVVSGERGQDLKRIADAISRELGINGPWFFQMKEDKDKQLKLLEVEPRIAGTMCLSRAQGVNMPLLTVLQGAGQAVQARSFQQVDYVDRALTNKFPIKGQFDCVYVDWDDTLLMDGRLNTELVGFLYDCVNGNKRIVLVTKSLDPGLNKLLSRWRIRELFDDVIRLKETDRKADYMRHPNSIYIDDSFSQLMDAKEKLGIRVYHPSMIETLKGAEA